MKSSYTTSLSYIDYDSSAYTKIPKPALNGGWYTGQPFKKNAGWATVPVIPDSGYMTHYNIHNRNKTAPGADTQYGNVRPGNNCFLLEGVYYYNRDIFNFYCDGSGGRGAPNKNQCGRKSF
jgi:hypothetical protein